MLEVLWLGGENSAVVLRTLLKVRGRMLRNVVRVGLSSKCIRSEGSDNRKDELVLYFLVVDSLDVVIILSVVIITSQ